MQKNLNSKCNILITFYLPILFKNNHTSAYLDNNSNFSTIIIYKKAIYQYALHIKRHAYRPAKTQEYQHIKLISNRITINLSPG